MGAALEDPAMRVCRLLVLTLSGCVIPLVHNRREKPQTPEAVQRFSAQAHALTRAPGAPSLPEVTRSMSVAIEALPDVTDGDRLASEVRTQAEAMRQRAPNETDALARTSLNAALEAVRRAKPNVPQADKDQAVEVARRAIEKIDPAERATVDVAYREVASAMVVVTGGRTGAATGSELSQLVARFAVEQPDDARRTGAQAIAAMSDALAAPAARAGARTATPPASCASARSGSRRPRRSSMRGSSRRRCRSWSARSLAPPRRPRIGACSTRRRSRWMRSAPIVRWSCKPAAAQDALRLVTDAMTVSVTAR